MLSFLKCKSGNIFAFKIVTLTMITAIMSVLLSQYDL